MSQAEEYQHHHSYRSSWLAPAPASLTPHDTSAFEGGADYFGMVDFDSGRRQPFYSLDDSFEDRGTPVNGIYARDGLWDEEDDSEVLSSAPGTSSKGRSGTASVNTSGPSRAGSSVTPSTARSSMRIRSRSGTVSSAKGKDVDEGDKGMWGWARRGRPSDPPAPAVTATVTVEKKVKKRDSKGLLKGKGRRGELTVQVDNEETNVPPLPSTPASYLRTPNTGSPFVFSPTSPAVRLGENSPMTQGGEKKGSWKRGVSKLFRSKSSAVLRDITSDANAPPTPTTPAIPAKFAHLQTDRAGKPMSASTPPMTIMQSQSQQKSKVRSSLAAGFTPGQMPTAPISPMSPAAAQQFGLHPELPSDPFASTLTSAGTSPPTTGNDGELPLPTRPKVLKSSSSFQSLKDLFTQKQPRSPLLSKTKSMANIKSRMTPEVIPEVPTPTSSTPSNRTPRPSSPVAETVAPEPSPIAETEVAPLAEEAPDMPYASPALPVESPPLMLPAPPFSRSGSSRLSNSSTPSSNVTSPGFYSSSSSSSNGTPQLAINTAVSAFPFPSPTTLPPLPASAPTSPLPPLPTLPMPSMQALAECAEGDESPGCSSGSKPTSPLVPRRVVKKSSSHVLLPRSRSTSMSLKSPPTSSSFFDLYEQLGIWPTQEAKEEKDGVEKVQTETLAKKGVETSPQSIKDTLAVPGKGDNFDDIIPITSMSASSSGLFSSASWEAAVNAFPEIPHIPESNMPDEARLSYQYSEDTALANTSNIAVLAVSPTTSQTHTAPSSPVMMSRDGSHTQTADSGQGGAKSSGGGQGSGSSSNEQSSGSYNTASAGPSRGRSGASGMPIGGGSGGNGDDDDEEERWYDSWSHASDFSSEEEDDEDQSSDDVPLSQIHPGAVAAQKARKARHAAARRDKRTKGKLEQIKLVGRNPGGESGWNGEGGVPGDVLRMKLEKLSIPAPNPGPSSRGQSPMATGAYPWAASAGAVKSADQPRMRVHSGGRERTAPVMHDAAMPTGHVGRRPSAPTLGSANVVNDKNVSRRPSRQAMQAFPATSHLTGYTFEQVQYGGKSPVMPTFDTLQAGPPVTVARSSSRHTSGGNSTTTSAGVSRRPTMSTSHGSAARVPQMAPKQPMLDAPAAGLGRSNTVSSRKGPSDSRSSSTRKRAQSNAALHKPPSSDLPPVPHVHARGATEPVRSEHVPAPAPAPAPAPPLPTIKFFVNLASSDNRLVSYPLSIDCTAHDILAAAARSGDISPPPGGMTWVVAELFGELGCERVLREYEEMGTVMRGWEGRKGAEGAGRNSFVIRQEIGDGSLIKAIPQTAPFVGAWAQYENKGKWHKRWLETRGGQVFMAKNEKNKDEVQINTLFGDVYHVTRHVGAPRAFTFVIKRMEPEASFDKRDDWAHIFSMDEGVGYKLMSAIYDAKSFTLRPHLLARQGGQHQGPTQGASTAQVHRRPTIPAQGPLVDIQKQIKKEEKKGPFTGKGLLRL